MIAVLMSRRHFSFFTLYLLDKQTARGTIKVRSENLSDEWSKLISVRRTVEILSLHNGPSAKYGVHSTIQSMSSGLSQRAKKF